MRRLSRLVGHNPRVNLHWGISDGGEVGWRSMDEAGNWVYTDDLVKVTATLRPRPVLELYGRALRGDGFETAELEVDLGELLDWLLKSHRGRRLVLEALMRAESEDEVEAERRFLKAVNAKRAALYLEPLASPYGDDDSELEES